MGGKIPRLLIASAMLALSLFILVIAAIQILENSHQEQQTVSINNTNITVEIADSTAEKQKGLCCRDSLDQDSGMLFVYEEAGDYRFWMKDTRISLDMYWISSEKKITHIEKNVKPVTYPRSFGTDIPSQYILETNSGFADRHNIKVGDTVQILKF